MQKELKDLEEELAALEKPALTPSRAEVLAPSLAHSRGPKEAAPDDETQPATERDLEMYRVQEEKRLLLEEVMALRKERSSLSSRASADSTGTPSPKVAAPSPNITSTPSVAPTQRSDESGDDGNQQEGMDEKITRDDKGRLFCNGKLLSDSAVDQRLRRWCTKKKHGGLKCSQEIYDRYHTQGHDARMELIQVFKDALLNKDECQRKVRKLSVEETGKTLKVQAGWYTERQMKDTLGWPKHEIDSVVAYTAARPKLRRKWKYNDKIDQHYVEVDESGELTKKYIQTKEEEEVNHTDKPVEFKKLSLDDPAAIDRGSEAEAVATTPDGKPEAEVESQDNMTVLPKAMEALLAKSAKLRDIQGKVEGTADDSVVQSLKTAYDAMDSHYDVLATSLARLRAQPKNGSKGPDQLLQNIANQLEFAELLGSKATRAEVQAQPALRAVRTKRKQLSDEMHNALPAPKTKVAKSAAKGKPKSKPAK